MSSILTIADMLAVNARLQPKVVGVRDLEREMTFELWHCRVGRLAGALARLGLKKGDRIAVLAYNRIEWAEIYVAVARAGFIAVPINFRLSAQEISFICRDCAVAAIIAENAFVEIIGEIQHELASHLSVMIAIGGADNDSWHDYETILTTETDLDSSFSVYPDDTWCLMYTSGTTGNPKGAIRTHRTSSLIAMMTCVELGFGRRDNGLLVMPMCHANSLYFFISLLSVGATTAIYSRASFDAKQCYKSISHFGITFTSLTPTHYIMLLDVPVAERDLHDVRGVSKLMISSATARVETKSAVMKMFPNAGLFELYGSTEAAWVTMLHPDEQLKHLGTVGREVIGSLPIKLLDDDGNEVPDGRPGELFSASPYNFGGYWNLPERTREAFRGDYLSVGDIAVRNDDGFIRLIDRKKNMIITGGENVYPTEVEAVLGAHPAVKDVAVVGCPDIKWGDLVTAAVVLENDAKISENELINWTQGRIAGFKRPRRVVFIQNDEMPRNATGKIMHRILRDMLSNPQSPEAMEEGKKE